MSGRADILNQRAGGQADSVEFGLNIIIQLSLFIRNMVPKLGSSHHPSLMRSGAPPGDSISAPRVSFVDFF
jgi:hypothetical protein